MKALLFLLLFLSLASVSLAEDCDYYDYENYTDETTRYYLGEELLEGTIEIENQVSDNQAKFKVYNPFDFDVDIEIRYVYDLSHWYRNNRHSISGTVPSKEYAILSGVSFSGSLFSFGTVELKPVSPPDFKKKIEKVTKQKPICKCNSNKIYCETSEKCVSKRDVPDDVRPPCGLYQECKSEFIDSETGLCARSPSQIKEEEEERLENELQIKEMEARKLEMEAKEREQQAEREKQEAERRAQEARELELEAQRRAQEARRLELEAQRLKLEAERAEQEAQRQHEQRKLMTYSIIAVIVLVVVLIIGGGIFILFSKIRLHEAKQKTLSAEIELEARHIESKEYDLEGLQKEIEEIQKHKKIQEKEQRKLDDLKSKVSKLNSDIEAHKKKLEEPFPDAAANNQLVVINRYLGGYKCFYQGDLPFEEYRPKDLVHRWVWKTHNNGRWPKHGYEIHHLDWNKYNNSIENLKEMETEKHRELHRMRFRK